MDVTSHVGLLLAWSVMAVAIFLSGGRLGSFWNTASLLVVIGGGLGATFMCLPVRVIRNVPAVLRKYFRTQTPDFPAIVKQLVGLAEIARRDGILALDARLTEINDPFIKLGVQLAVDGTRPEVVQEVLTAELEAMAGRHREGKLFLESIGKFTPAFGMIGTLLGLITMLGNMTDPSTIGRGMAIALLTTLYGALLSYASFLPMAEKLALASKQEWQARDLMIKGILAIQAGENPRVIEQRLSTFLPPGERITRDAA